MNNERERERERERGNLYPSLNGGGIVVVLLPYVHKDPQSTIGSGVRRLKSLVQTAIECEANSHFSQRGFEQI